MPDEKSHKRSELMIAVAIIEASLGAAALALGDRITDHKRGVAHFIFDVQKAIQDLTQALGRLDAGGVKLKDLQALEARLTALLKPCEQHSKPPRLIVFATGPDAPMKGKIVLLTLKKPIAPGFRRPFTVGFDEDVDVLPDGSYVKSEVVDGDSSAPTIKTSTARSVEGWINGDGALGKKLVRLTADGHVNEGEVPITLDVAYDVAHPDATEFKNFVEGGTDEQIPA